MRKRDKEEMQKALRNVNIAIAAAQQNTRAEGEAKTKASVDAVIRLADRMRQSLSQAHITNIQRNAKQLTLLNNRLSAARIYKKPTNKAFEDMKREETPLRGNSNRRWVF